MACLHNAKPLHKAMLTYCQLDCLAQSTNNISFMLLCNNAKYVQHMVISFTSTENMDKMKKKPGAYSLKS